MKTTLPVVTLDGPAGVGKTTLAQQLAESLHVAYLDTGAMFRCLALKLGPGAETLPEEELREKCRQWTFSLSGKGRASTVCCNGVPIRGEVRTEQVGMLAARIATVPVVRESCARPSGPWAKPRRWWWKAVTWVRWSFLTPASNSSWMHRPKCAPCAVCATWPPAGWKPIW